MGAVTAVPSATTDTPTSVTASSSWYAPTMIRIALVLPPTLIVLLTISCAGPPSASPEPQVQRGESANPQQSAPTNSDELERLRTLGYLDTTGIPKRGPGDGVTIIDPEASHVGNSLVVFASPCRVELAR